MLSCVQVVSPDIASHRYVYILVVAMRAVIVMVAMIYARIWDCTTL